MTVRNPAPNQSIDILATNLQGMGAVRLAESLLPALERNGGGLIGQFWLPDRGPISHYRPIQKDIRYAIYRRRLPNAISRLLECTLLSARFGRTGPILVLGDLPVRHQGFQVVLAHSSFLTGESDRTSTLNTIKATISRAIFRANLKWLDCVIVQTELMRKRIVETYPQLNGKVAVIPQPPPAWLLDQGDASRASGKSTGKLRLFFPAAPYPHKNHGMLVDYASHEAAERDLETITLTCDRPAGQMLAQRIHWLGQLDPTEMRVHYTKADALVFPSLEESYGFPLVEAMYLGLPILCADRPYAHTLCGDSAIYFDPLSPGSLADAVADLRQRLAAGWAPDWQAALSGIPRDWDHVAKAMLDLFPK